jgi:3,4-dihydroxy 2-butanone 4-phosphate synthase / GTP cyclohydrolase II
MVMLDSIEAALDRYRSGGMLVVVDDENRENEGDLCVAASHATPEIVNFMARRGCGLICVALDPDVVDTLKLHPMVPVEQNGSAHQTAFTVSVEAATNVTTGISAYDRAHTIRLLASPTATAKDFVRPGHIFPLRARAGGVLARNGHTEAGVDLSRLAGLPPAAAICEVMAEDGTMMRLPELREFAREHDLMLISIADLVAYRRAKEAERLATVVKRVATTVLPSNQGSFDVHVFLDADGREHLALVMGSVNGGDAPLARLHSECLTGDVFGSRRCDCGLQMDAGLAKIAEERRGVFLYLRQEGRGIGLAAKLRAYALQDRGFDTVEANHQLGYPADARDYTVAAAILNDLGVHRVKLMTNNPVKIQALNCAGIMVSERVALELPATAENVRYLTTKRIKLGHTLILDAADAR